MDAKNLTGFSIKLNLLKRKLRKELSEKVLKNASQYFYPMMYNNIAIPDKTIIINIDDIFGWYTISRYKEISFQGQIKGGDWSKKIKLKDELLKTSDKYISVCQRFEKNYAWKDTCIFKNRYSHFLNKGIQVKGCTNLDDLEKHYVENYDSLFENLKTNGVKPATIENPGIDPIYINIGALGEILYTGEGNHRLFMCLILDIKQMPVQVWMRHKSWQSIRDEFSRKENQNSKKVINQYQNHPDFDKSKVLA